MLGAIMLRTIEDETRSSLQESNPKDENCIGTMCSSNQVFLHCRSSTKRIFPSYLGIKYFN